MEYLVDRIGDSGVLALAGLIVGLAFGVTAQQSAFCLRAAVAELAAGRAGPRLATWLLAFCAALAAVQGGLAAGLVDLGEARIFAAAGSLSGAVIGGLMFGAGMILARGCASRLLILASTGNLRALVTGLILTLVAQASYKGVASPVREYLAGIWTVPAGSARDLAAWLHLPAALISVLALISLILVWMWAGRQQMRVRQRLFSVGVGTCVALGWGATYWVSQVSFDLVPVSSITFTGPATDTLMVLATQRNLTFSFGTGLVPGVALGAMMAAVATGQWALRRFGPETPMERYLAGAVLMGFGAMLAGGCAVGAGLSGGSAMSLTAWVAVFCIWVGALATHHLMQHRARRGAALPQ